MSSGEPRGESTQPQVAIDVVREGLTNRATLTRPGSEETQLAQLPERPSTPATEIVQPVAPARPESGPLPSRTSTPATEIVQPVAPAGLGLDAAPDLPLTQSTGETSFNPEVYRRRRLFYTTSTAALLLIILTSIYQILALGGSDESAVAATTGPPVPVPPTDPSEPPTVARPALTEEPRGRKTSRLLALTLDEILPGGRSSAVEAGDEPIEANAVTIVNLWATYCEPCKEELPGFAALLARNSWGDDVRFTPILIDDKDPVWAYSKFASLMPKKGSRFFADPLQAVVEALREPKLLQPDSGLPVTLVYDCRQRARVVYTQRLSPADFDKLEEIVHNLRGELNSSYCKPRPRRPAQTREPPAALLPVKLPVKPSPARCGNNICELGESADNCCDCRCACLRCPEGKRCESPNGEAICVDSVIRLKD